MNFIELKNFYIEQIEKDFFPFWEKAFDKNRGGIFTCFNNKGTKLISKNKYTRSQGRFLWLVSALYEQVEKESININKSLLEKMGNTTFEFLKNNVFFDGYKCAFALTEDGQQIDFNGIKDTSIFADAFVLLGFNAYGRNFGNEEALKISNELLNSIKSRIDSNDYMTEPYPVDENFKSHSIYMILLNCYEECLLTEKLNKYRYDLDLEKLVNINIDVILNELSDEDLVYEMFTENRSYNDTLLFNHNNPGHTIECIWFILYGLKLTGNDREIKQKIIDIFKKTYYLGWDSKYGGLLRYVDRRTGCEPEGRLLNNNLENLIKETWDYKLWWPHSELLYTSLLIYVETNDDEVLEIYKKSQEYIFETFPNPDKNIGEWIQIRDRKGNPINKVVALPVKDPFHIIRNFILIIDLLNQEGY